MVPRRRGLSGFPARILILGVGKAHFRFSSALLPFSVKQRRRCGVVREIVDEERAEGGRVSGRGGERREW